MFCKICDNMLSAITTADKFYFKCVRCQVTYEPEPNDTLRYEDIKGTNLLVYKTILKNAGRDPVNPKVRKTCTGCGNKIAKQVRLGDDMRLINVCTKCGKQWIEGLAKVAVK